MSGPPRHGPTRPPIPHHPSVAHLHLLTPDESEFEEIRAEVDARNAVIETCIAEHHAQAAAQRLTFAALTAPVGSAKHAAADHAKTGAREAAVARRTAVAHLITITEATR